MLRPDREEIAVSEVADDLSADLTEERARAARVWSELTKGQRDFLWWARHWTDREHGDDTVVGCHAKGSTIRAADALVSRKLCTYQGMCVNVDDHNEAERPTYAITPWGRVVVAIGD